MKNLLAKKNFNDLKLIIFENKIKFFKTANLRKQLKCDLPIITNKIKAFLILGFILRTHRKKNNVNQSYTFFFPLSKGVVTFTVPAQAPVFKFYTVKD